MKRLVTYIGGHKLTNENLEYIQSAAKEINADFVKSMLPAGVNKTILWGVDIVKTGNDYTHTAGAIYYDGEIYTVEALVNPLTELGVPKFSITQIEEFIIGYANAEERVVHINKKMVLAPQNDPNALFDYNSIYNLQRLLHQKSEAPGVVKHVKMNATDISIHFDTNGIGISDWWTGWKIDADSKGRVIVGYTTTSVDYNNANGSKKGGAEIVTLTALQSGLRDHGHVLNLTPQTSINSTAGNSGAFARSTGSNVSDGLMNYYAKEILNSGAVNAQEPHENRQPYVVYLNVEKL